jgi:hypothetical protein
LGDSQHVVTTGVGVNRRIIKSFNGRVNGYPALRANGCQARPETA